MEEKKRENYARNSLIFYRLKPSKDFSFENLKVQSDFKAVHARRVQDCSPNIFHTPLYLEYKCDSVFYRQPQQTVYSTIMKDVLARVVEGCDATILSYGQTGSGKTHTISGLRDSFEHTGIVPRFLAELFELQTTGFTESLVVYKMSYVELIEPTHIRDLLVKACDKKIGKLKYQDRLKIASRIVIPSEMDALRLLFSGESQRSVESAAPYRGANCSHTVLTIYISTRSTNKSQPGVTCGKIHFVDMLGTNCASNIRCHLLPREQGQGNLAKMLLEQYIARLNQTSEHVPMSQNWTSIVLDYLGGSLNRQAIMRFIGHVHGSANDLEVTHSTLRFGTVVNAVRPLPLARCLGIDKVLQKINDQEELACLSRQRFINRACERELRLNNGEAQQLSIARVDHLRRLVKQYLRGEVPEEVIVGLHQTPLFLQLCKEFISNMKSENLKDKELLQALRKKEEDILLLPEKASSQDSAATVGEDLDGRASGSLEGLASKSQESQKSNRTASKEGTRSGKSIKKVKRNTSETSKKNKSSSQTRKPSFGDQSSRELLPADIECPSLAVAWAAFMVDRDAQEMQEDVRGAELAYKQSNKAYEASKSGIMEASLSLEEVRKELYLAQKLRHLSKDAMYTSRGRLDRERTLKLLCYDREVEFNTMMDAMHMRKLLKNKTAINLSNARRKIETSYQTFCIAKYGVPMPGLGLCAVEKDACVKTNQSFELYYYKMQESILLSSPNDSKKRNQIWYSDRCLSNDYMTPN